MCVCECACVYVWACVCMCVCVRMCVVWCICVNYKKPVHKSRPIYSRSLISFFKKKEQTRTNMYVLIRASCNHRYETCPSISSDEPSIHMSKVASDYLKIKIKIFSNPGCPK